MSPHRGGGVGLDEVEAEVCVCVCMYGCTYVCIRACSECEIF